MTEIKINIADLKSEGDETIKELSKFLKEKTEVDVNVATDSITVKSKEETVSRTHLRLLLKKFLHKKELKDNYRVLGGEKDTLIVKEKKIAEEE